MFFANKRRLEQLGKRIDDLERFLYKSILDQKILFADKNIVEELESNVANMSIHVADLEKKLSDLEQQSDEVSPGSLIQQGIDNIMGFQWPPAKGGER